MPSTSARDFALLSVLLSVLRVILIPCGFKAVVRVLIYKLCEGVLYISYVLNCEE
jgi:hypothetical protein